ncbi:dipeptidase PepV [Anaerovorax odorimutans]|uniref:Dipeptidase PepV n=1 Tax=Anaerovorax odorimutans TaxID=109327 RepID=A0ABT1RMI7_9FIRM|nr:dipeptidase PepV [Anaerovorax odorimutans]MCQ4636146.1 dipeptidase PepV [Anaerovorax odorimutans]
MEYLESINNNIEENKEQMIRTLQELIRIKSIAEDTEGEYPFGEGVQQALDYMMKKGEEEGFVVRDVDHYGGHIDLTGKGGGIMGIVGHLDVVPEGTDWDYEPYGGVLADGKIYGRGTMDDKGPVIASFYAMKAVKDSGAPLKDTVRLILGLDEETNWKGMNHYLSKVAPPDYGFTPDGDFPAIHGEKGILVFEIAKKLNGDTAKGLELRSLSGGNAANMVADHARAVVRDTTGGGYDEIREKAASFREEKQVKVTCKGIGKSLEISAEGVSAHGAKPEQGVNAISILMDFLGTLSFANEDTNEFIDFYNSCIGYELDGESLGCGLYDEPSGKLVLNVGMAAMDGKAASVTVNVRYPVTSTGDKVYESIMPVLDRYNLGVVKEKHEEPIYIPADDPMIVTLMDIYKRQTGDESGEPLVIGGGTYARAMKNVIAFGARFPGEPELGHQKNECLSVDSLVAMTKIYAEAIFRLACDPGNEENS